jgi:hypothetical protein
LSGTDISLSECERLEKELGKEKVNDCGDLGNREFIKCK